MTFTINTTALQNAVTKAIKASGFNKLLPITSMIGIRAVDGSLQLTTTDGTNYLYVQIACEVPEDFSVVVDANIFARLVSKLTSESVNFEVTDEALIVKGNGEYKLALQLNDNGEILSYPNPYESAEVVDTWVTVHKSVIDVMLNSIKPALSTVAGSVYTNYYVGDVIAGTDRAMFSSFDNSSFVNARLLTREFVDLLGLMSDNIEIAFGKDEVIAKDGNLSLYAKNNAETEGFQIDKINGIMSIEMDSYCKLNKQALLSTLERIAIFVGEFDDSAIKLTFSKTALSIESLATTGIESIDYMESKNAVDMTVKIDINRLITQLKAYGSDAVDIYYGNEKMLKLKDGTMTQVIAYMI